MSSSYLAISLVSIMTTFLFDPERCEEIVVPTIIALLSTVEINISFSGILKKI